MKTTTLLRLLCFVLLFQIATFTGWMSLAQTAGRPIDELRQSLVGQTLTVKIAGLHSATRVFFRPIDDRIVNGALRARAIEHLRMSTETTLAPGTTVQVTKLEAAGDSHNDILRVVATAPNGGMFR